jgi:hypothetical protein
MQLRRLKVFHPLIIESWWFLLFLSCSLLIYSHIRYRKEMLRNDLQKQIAQLLFEKQEAEFQKAELTAQIRSQNDPAWIEIILKKRLGLVPQGQMKVFFKKEE